MLATPASTVQRSILRIESKTCFRSSSKIKSGFDRASRLRSQKRIAIGKVSPVKIDVAIRSTGQNYDALITYLQSGDWWAKPLKSSFLVKTSVNVSDLRDGLLKHIDSNDDVLVINVDGKSWASYGLPDEINNWIRDNL